MGALEKCPQESFFVKKNDVFLNDVLKKYQVYQLYQLYQVSRPPPFSYQGKTLKSYDFVARLPKFLASGSGTGSASGTGDTIAIAPGGGEKKRYDSTKTETTIKTKKNETLLAYKN